MGSRNRAWVCSICTYKNKDESPRCGVCNCNRNTRSSCEPTVATATTTTQMPLIDRRQTTKLPSLVSGDERVMNDEPKMCRRNAVRNTRRSTGSSLQSQNPPVSGQSSSPPGMGEYATIEGGYVTVRTRTTTGRGKFTPRRELTGLRQTLTTSSRRSITGVASSAAGNRTPVTDNLKVSSTSTKSSDSRKTLMSAGLKTIGNNRPHAIRKRTLRKVDSRARKRGRGRILKGDENTLRRTDASPEIGSGVRRKGDRLPRSSNGPLSKDDRVSGRGCRTSSRVGTSSKTAGITSAVNTRSSSGGRRPFRISKSAIQSRKILSKYDRVSIKKKDTSIIGTKASIASGRSAGRSRKASTPKREYISQRPKRQLASISSSKNVKTSKMTEVVKRRPAKRITQRKGRKPKEQIILPKGEESQSKDTFRKQLTKTIQGDSSNESHPTVNSCEATGNQNTTRDRTLPAGEGSNENLNTVIGNLEVNNPKSRRGYRRKLPSTLTNSGEQSNMNRSVRAFGCCSTEQSQEARIFRDKRDPNLYHIIDRNGYFPIRELYTFEVHPCRKDNQEQNEQINK